MTAEDRAAHVEREAVAGVLAKHQKVASGMGARTPDTCRCGAETMYVPGDEDVSIRRDRAFAVHQADAVLAALPQTGDAAAASEWPCDNYTEPVTCLSARASETGTCRICRIRAADRIIAALLAGADQ